MTDKALDAYRTISEVAEDLDLPQHVLRFWETRFTQIKPLKRGGGRRYYRRDDVALLRGIKHLLYAQGYTIKGVQRILRDEGPKAVHRLVGGGEGEPISVASPDPTMQPDAAMPVAGASVALSPGALAHLNRALAELGECRRLLQDARASSV
jgi:DNA-binding transcriptional MerR regulator